LSAVGLKVVVCPVALSWMLASGGCTSPGASFMLIKDFPVVNNWQFISIQYSSFKYQLESQNQKLSV
jgi:hypothetical protein